MTPDRCPACNAAVPAGAEWCTLCYTVLRVPETVPATPVPASQAAAAPVPHAAAAVDAPLPPDPILDAPSLDAPVTQAAAVARRPSEGWPCVGCGGMVPLADDTCPQCGRPFLPSDTMPALALPVVGDLSRMDRGQRIVTVVVLALLATGLLVGLAFIAGSVL